MLISDNFSTKHNINRISLQIEALVTKAALIHSPRKNEIREYKLMELRIWVLSGHHGHQRIVL
jgi:hypothetical protein